MIFQIVTFMSLSKCHHQFVINKFVITKSVLTKLALPFILVSVRKTILVKDSLFLVLFFHNHIFPGWIRKLILYRLLL